MLKEKKTIVILGCGEIGEPIYKLCCSAYKQVIVDDIKYPEVETPKFDVEAMHVAIPGSLEDFNSIVKTNYNKYKPQIILVNSSTIPGTVDKIAEAIGIDNVVHTQVHGKHRGNRMRADMLNYPKFIATKSDIAFEKAKKVLLNMGHPPEKIKRLSSPLSGEIVKLLATTFFGFLVAWTQEIERLSDKCGVSFEELMSFTQLETKDFDITNKFPGIIAGHCVMQNIEILKKTYPSDLWDYLISSNQKKKERENNK